MNETGKKFQNKKNFDVPMFPMLTENFIFVGSRVTRVCDFSPGEEFLSYELFLDKYEKFINSLPFWAIFSPKN
jgi:hypothetical protein